MIKVDGILIKNYNSIRNTNCYLDEISITPIFSIYNEIINLIHLLKYA